MDVTRAFLAVVILILGSTVYIFGGTACRTRSPVEVFSLQ